MGISASAGKRFVLGAIAFTLFASTVPVYVLWNELEFPRPTMFVLAGIFILEFLMYRGSDPARWVTAALLGAAAVALLVTGTIGALQAHFPVVPPAVLVALGIAALLFAGLLSLPAAGVFLRERREEETSPPAPVPGAPTPPPLPFSVSPPPPEPPAVWMRDFSNVLLLLGITLSVISYFRAPFGDAYETGYATGNSLGSILLALLLAWPLWRFVHKKRRGAMMLWFSALYPGLLVLSLFGHEPSDKMSPAASDAMQAMGSRMLENQDVRTISIDAERCGRWTPFLLACRDWYVEIQATRWRFEAEQAACHVENVPSAEVLGDAEKIHDARRRVATAAAALDRYQKEIRESIDSAERRFNNVRMPRKMAGPIIKGMRAEFERSAAQLESLRATQKTLFREYDETLKFMESRQGSYVADGGKVLFDADNDLRTYNAHLKRTHDLYDNQVRIIEGLQGKVRKTLSGLKAE